MKTKRFLCLFIILCMFSFTAFADGTLSEEISVAADSSEEYVGYSNMFNWACWNRGDDKPTDLFFVCPTVDMGKEGNFNSYITDEKYRESFDVATARAVGRLNLICELALPLIKVGGRFLAMKSLSTKEELEEARHAIEVLGGQVENVVEYTLTDGQETLERTIVIIKKIKKTPTLYPRNNSQISKKPL